MHNWGNSHGFPFLLSANGGEKLLPNRAAKMLFLPLEKRESMKKLNFIFGIIIFAAVILFSCEDDSGLYVEQLYTNSQKEKAIKACLTVSSDSALNHLCAVGGFSSYRDGIYSIDYAPLNNSLFDTLSRHGYGYLCDSLVTFSNRLAENCKAQLAPCFTSAIDTLIITDYDALIKGDLDAITNYFELLEYRYLTSAFQTPVSIRMSLFGVSQTWNEMLQRYAQYSTVPISFDVQNYMVDKMLDGLLQEMRIEERLIRTDTSHRNEDMEAFGD